MNENVPRRRSNNNLPNAITVSADYYKRQTDLIDMGDPKYKGMISVSGDVVVPLIPTYFYLDRRWKGDGITYFYYRDVRGMLYYVITKNLDSCEMVCTTNYEPVCGTDYKTYGNRCELDATHCATNGYVVYQHKGECNTIDNVSNVYKYTNKIGEIFIYVFPKNKNEKIKYYLQL